MSHRRRFAVAFAVAMVGVLALLGWATLRPAKRLTASNTEVIASRYELPIKPGDLRCEGNQYVPKDAAFLRVYARSWVGGPIEPLTVSVTTRGGARVARWRWGGGGRRGPIVIPVPRLGRSAEEGSVCIRNRGRATVGLAGNLTPLNPEGQAGAVPPGQPSVDLVRLDWLRAHPQRYVQLASDVATRWSLFRPSFVRPWTLGVVAALFLLLGALTLRVMLTEVRDP